MLTLAKASGFILLGLIVATIILFAIRGGGRQTRYRP